MSRSPAVPAFGAVLPPSVRRRLEFLYDNPDDLEPSTPCRLPGCTGRVQREVRTGRPRWFHDSPTCAREFRRRRAALDGAVAELAKVLRSDTLSARAAYTARSHLTWLLNVRATYAAPDEWGFQPPKDSGGGLDLADIAALGLALRAERGTECLSCDGTGVSSLRQSSLQAVRSVAYALNDVSDLLRTQGDPTEPGIATALSIVDHEAEVLAQTLNWAEQPSHPDRHDRSSSPVATSSADVVESEAVNPAETPIAPN